MQRTETVTEYKFGKATVRTHGTLNSEKFDAAIREFVERVLIQQRQQGRAKGGETDVLHGRSLA